MSVYPFVNPLMKMTANVSSTFTLIFGNDQHTCFIDSILVTNTSDLAIDITLTVAREEIIGQEDYYKLAFNVPIKSKERIDILQGQALTFQAGDLLYANTDFNGGTCDIFVIYRELLETTPTAKTGVETNGR
jgi:hypothetical protein